MNAEPTASSQLALFAAYHGWANAVLLSHVGKVSGEQYRAPLRQARTPVAGSTSS